MKKTKCQTVVEAAMVYELYGLTEEEIAIIENQDLC
jgi:hypothetical protein